jgi:hypothetical protein
MSLRMLGSAGVPAAATLIDVGGGATPLTRALLDRAIGMFGCLAPAGRSNVRSLPVARYSPAQLARQLGAKWALDQPGPGGTHHPGRCCSAVHLYRAAKRILSPGLRARLQPGFSAISQNPSAGSICASINACSAASRSGLPNMRAR